MSTTSQLFDAAGGYQWMPGSAASLGVLIVAVFRRIIRSWIRLIMAVIVAVAVGFGVTVAAMWAVESDTHCACGIADSSLFH